MQPFSITFFGSFQEYSLIVLKALLENFSVTSIITTPPKPAGRHLELTPNPVHLFAQQQHLPVYPLDNLENIPAEISSHRPDFIVVAGYGKLIPPIWLNTPRYMAINFHPSLLPQYPGRFPAEWAIYHNQTSTGITLIKMSSEFDKGEILVQKSLPIDPEDTKDTLYKKLFTVGAQILVSSLAEIATGKIIPRPQPLEKHFYARQLTREDGFVPYEIFVQQLNSGSEAIYRKWRAFYPWPGVWTLCPNQTRLKLIAITPKILVQEEGQKPIEWTKFQSKL